MANSNSKLDTFDKQDRKRMLEEFKGLDGTLHSFPQYGVTIGIVPNAKEGDTPSKTAMMYTSIASNEEKKFRRKVGEFHALNRWELGQGTIIPNPDYPGSFAEEIAATFDSVSDFSGYHDDSGRDFES